MKAVSFIVSFRFISFVLCLELRLVVEKILFQVFFPLSNVLLFQYWWKISIV